MGMVFGRVDDATRDWRDRLVGVGEGGFTTDIVLDPLGRMVGKVRHTPEGDVARAYLHDGDQVVLEYVQQPGGTSWQPEHRHIWARWIDDLAVEEVDTDADGTLDATLYPITDLLGSVQLLTDDAGAPVERITYDPDGTPHFWSADTTRPHVTRVAWTGDGTSGNCGAGVPPAGTCPAQAFEIGLSEPIDPASAANATATLTPSGGNPAILTLTLAADNRTAYLTGATVAAGTQYTLHVDGLTDPTHNPIWSVDATLTVTDPDAYEFLNDTTAPQLLAVLDASDALYLLFDEPVEPAPGFDLDTAITLTRQGQPVAGTRTRLTANLLKWQPTAGTDTLVPGGAYTVAALHLQDLAANALTAPAGLAFTHLTTTPDLLYLAYHAPSDSQPETRSAYGLTTLFQGRTWHPDLGMYYYRARWYLPQIDEFAERDPMEITGLPDLYVAFSDSPIQRSDPFGEWDFDLSLFVNSPIYLDSIEDIKKKARILVFTRPTKRYLRFRFGPKVNDAYLRRISSNGTPPRVEFNKGSFDQLKIGAFAFYRDRTIYLTPYVARAQEAALNSVNWRHPRIAQRLVEAVQWSMAVTLVHETIHFIDEDIDGQEAVDAHMGGYDTGDKWEYFLFGSYNHQWGPPHYLDSTTARELLKFLDWVEVVQDPEMQKLNAERFERRWLRITSFLEREHRRRRSSAREGVPQ